MTSGGRRDASPSAHDEALPVTLVQGEIRLSPSARPAPVGPSTDSSAVTVGEVIAEGGMGVIRAAVQRSLGRPVVVKTSLPHGTSDDAQRMLLEAWVTGYLEHPGIVPVYDIVKGEDEAPVVVMRRIRGKTWQTHLHDTEWAQAQGARDLLEQNLRVLIRVCEIVEFAHAKHVVHRDLKPGNVMVGAFGEIYLLDWGLAVATGGEPAKHLPHAELAKDACGTLSYAAPEMVGLISAPVSPRTDVYLLGAVLFELATGKPPHRTLDTRDAVESIDTTPPEMPASMSSHLRLICARALQKEPDDRYADVSALRRDVLAFLRHRDSEHIIRQAERTLGRLREACAKDEPRPRLYDLYGECRFAFREALRTWPEHETAHDGLLAAARTMIEHEVDRDPRVAAALLEEAPAEIPDLSARVQAALAAEEAQREALSKVARDHDSSIGRRGRRIFLIVMGILWSAGQLADLWAPITYRRFVTGSLVQLPLIALFWAIIPELRATLFNRRMISTVAVTIGAQSILFSAGAVFGFDLAGIRTVQVALWAVVTTLLTVLLERRYWPMATAFVAMLVAVMVAPHLRPFAAMLAFAIVTANVALVSGPRKER